MDKHNRPENGTGRSMTHCDPRNRNENSNRRSIADEPTVNKGQLDRASLIFIRLAEGLLKLFQCSGCGAVESDVRGWNGRRQPLCEKCADGESEVPHDTP